jgi:hypothetical protein
MSKTSQGHPDDNRSIVLSRAERYKQWESKKSAPSPPPLARTRRAKVKKIALTTINDVTSPLSDQSSNDDGPTNGLPPPDKSAYLEQRGKFRKVKRLHGLIQEQAIAKASDINQRKSPPEFLGQMEIADAANNDARNGIPPDDNNDVDGRKYDDVDNDDEEDNVDDGNAGYDDDEEFKVDVTVTTMTVTTMTRVH